jgi:polysaccharide biosynthesis PFTS motif protein
LAPEQILSKGRTEPLGEFFREQRFQELFCGKYLVVESKKLYRFFRRNNYNGMEIVFDTSIWIAKNGLTRRIILRVIKESVSKLMQVIRNGKRDEFQALRELVVDEPVWRYYLKESLQTNEINIVTTQSQFLRLPYAFYIDAKDRVVTSMLWYSTNSNVIQNRKTQALFDPEHFRFDSIRNHFVWTSEQKLSLLQYNPTANIVVTGSILFRPRKNVEKSIQNLNRNIVIFDVTPFDGLDVQVLYNSEVMTDFIEDLVNTFSSHSNTNSARVLLKPKREYGTKLRGGLSHSTQYMGLIDKMESLKSLEILKPDVDLYQLVGNADLVVGIPFTSPVVLAKELNVPSFFYVPESARDWDIAASQDGVEVINGRNQLEIFIQGLK